LIKIKGNLFYVIDRLIDGYVYVCHVVSILRLLRFSN